MLAEKLSQVPYKIMQENHTVITPAVGYYNITHPKSECMMNETEIESGGKHRHSC